MDERVTTTGSNFPVIDITHKPRRYQGDSITNDTSSVSVSDNVVHSNIPQNPTLESAITFYLNNADGNYKSLYSFTANWLKSILQSKNIEVRKNDQDTDV